MALVNLVELTGNIALAYTLPDDAEFSSSELVGVLMAVDANGDIKVLDRRGNPHDVAIGTIQALKVFPS